MGSKSLGHYFHALTRQGRWMGDGQRGADDIVLLFAAVGRYDRIADSGEKRFGGLTDALNARANPALPGHLPRDLIQDIRRVPHAFRSFSRAEA